ncbi:MAG: glycosyltransferase family 2 protein, partial [Bacteroidaceae bacterium]|nr:glycosyltransferase family 2 protein [Bacteroidaceae bacterium]
MAAPSVSIIVPVYNVQPYVEDCIRSVMRQTYDGRMECIVVDDCGTDDSIAIVEKVVADYDGPITFKILHHTHNRGLSAARNTGIDASTGDYLFFLDSDDEITNDCIKKLSAVLEKDGEIEIVQGNTRQLPMITPDPLTRNVLIPHASSNR